MERLCEKSSDSDEPPRNEANHHSVHARFSVRTKSLVITAASSEARFALFPYPVLNYEDERRRCPSEKVLRDAQYPEGRARGGERPFRTPIEANSEVRNANTFGVLKLTLYPNSYEWKFVPVAGKTFTDCGTSDCH